MPGIGGKNITPISLGAKLNCINSSEGYKIQNKIPGKPPLGFSGADSPTLLSDKEKKELREIEARLLIPLLSWHLSYAKCKYGSCVRKFNTII